MLLDKVTNETVLPDLTRLLPSFLDTLSRSFSTTRRSRASPILPVDKASLYKISIPQFLNS